VGSSTSTWQGSFATDVHYGAPVPIGAAVVACVVLAALAGFQACLALGAPWGRLAWGGRHDGVLPAGLRVASAVSIVLYAGFAAMLADRADLAHVMADGVSRVGVWGLVGYFGLGVLMNGISRSPGERAVMTPTVLVLGICAVLVALAP
jgi:hypothetical protein